MELHNNDTSAADKPKSNLFTSKSKIYDNVSKISKKKLNLILTPPSKPQKPPTPITPICKYVEGDHLKIGDTIFINGSNSNNKLYSTQFKDYTLITNADFTNFIDLMPKEIKPLLSERWHYVIHVSHGMQLSVKRSDLIARVLGGEILAFKYTECSIEGNDCAYYGFVPTLAKSSEAFGEDTHRICRYALQEIWPRKLYLHIKLLSPCDCTPDVNCIKCIITYKDGTTNKQTCLKRLPWNSVYLMMGDADEECVDQLKTPRECVVCAQCNNCSKSANFCRIHRVCKHKQTIISLKSGFEFKNSKIKACKKFKR